MRNEIVHTIRKAKRDYYTDQVTNNKGAKHMWKTLGNLMKSKQSKAVPATLEADACNSYFSSVGSSLNEKFPKSPELHWTQPNCIHSFHFTDISEDAVLKQLSSLDSKSNIDVLDYDSRLFKEGAEVLVTSLTMLFNKSLKCGRLPSDWKQARVTPVFKGKGSAEEIGNYRPISVISHVAKMFERCVSLQLTDYLETHNFITGDQSAFRKSHSTNTAAHKVFEDIYENINDGLVVGACLFDLSKCFDTIDHQLLIKKMERYGIRGPELKWFADYLVGRSQTVRLHGQLSDFTTITTGVPQGSVLGPLLFLIFINDLPTCLKHSVSNIYADDTEIHTSGKSIDEVKYKLQRDVDNLTHWFKLNKLTVNIFKTVCMLFSSNPNVLNQELPLYIAGELINQVTSTRYLGIYPDSKLNWAKQADHICKTISPKVGLLSRLKHILPTNCLETIYKATIQSHIDYCLTLWGFSANIYIDTVQKFQNRAARIITGNFEYTTRGIDLVKQLGWHTIRERRDYLTALLVYKSLNGIAPTYLQDVFTFARDTHSRQTRSTTSNNLFVPGINKQVYSHSLQYNGSKIWNNLTGAAKEAQSLNVFKCIARQQS